MLLESFGSLENATWSPVAFRESLGSLENGTWRPVAFREVKSMIPAPFPFSVLGALRALGALRMLLGVPWLSV